MQLVLLMPLLMLLLWAVMQAALFHYGRTAAISAAHTGATAGAVHDGTAAGCRTAAADLLERVGDAISQVSIQCHRTPTRVTATISGTVLSVVPGWSASLTHTASAPVERITR